MMFSQTFISDGIHFYSTFVVFFMECRLRSCICIPWTRLPKCCGNIVLFNLKLLLVKVPSIASFICSAMTFSSKTNIPIVKSLHWECATLYCLYSTLYIHSLCTQWLCICYG